MFNYNIVLKRLKTSGLGLYLRDLRDPKRWDSKKDREEKRMRGKGRGQEGRGGKRDLKDTCLVYLGPRVTAPQNK